MVDIPIFFLVKSACLLVKSCLLQSVVENFIYPLLIQHSYGESLFLIGKSVNHQKTSINGPVSMAMLNNQRVFGLLNSWTPSKSPSFLVNSDFLRVKQATFSGRPKGDLPPCCVVRMRGGKGSLRAPGVPGFGAVARISDQLLAAGAAMCVDGFFVVALMVSETDIII
jgi:hypothetical protein